MDVQTINIELTINDIGSAEKYFATFYVYERHYGAFCPMVSTHVITGLAEGTTNIQISYKVPYETNDPLFRVGAVITAESSGDDQIGAAPWCNTNDLCRTVQSISVTF
ncbi:MAG: hypothetical protein CVU06_01420 [Bacteroidetes bacterium HGW-Bacteroidetes-22]|nr:MAG: hypothetical protein CVU06_01420 [Bacteroidetes bacterium HGW-Bacteroidetes-22]